MTTFEDVEGFYARSPREQAEVALCQAGRWLDELQRACGAETLSRFDNYLTESVIRLAAVPLGQEVRLQLKLAALARAGAAWLESPAARCLDTSDRNQALARAQWVAQLAASPYVSPVGLLQALFSPEPVVVVAQADTGAPPPAATPTMPAPEITPIPAVQSPPHPFPRDGAHATLPCSTCHTDGTFHAMSQECSSCHKPAHGNAVPLLPLGVALGQQVAAPLEGVRFVHAGLASPRSTADPAVALCLTAGPAPTWTAWPPPRCPDRAGNRRYTLLPAQGRADTRPHA